MDIPSPTAGRTIESGFGSVRDFLGNQFVSLTVSPRAGGLAIDVDLTPDRSCNLNCEYCEAAIKLKWHAPKFSVPLLEAEFRKTLGLFDSGAIMDLPRYCQVPPELQQLRHVAISGSGEPTLCPEFREAVEVIVQVRACQACFFKMVLCTNGTLLDSPVVQEGLQYFTARDEVWIKLDVGMDASCNGTVPVEKILANIVTLGRRRPIVIQSLIPSINGQLPSDTEINQFIRRLSDIKTSGARIETVQLYSATPSRWAPGYGHLPLHALNRIGLRVRSETGLPTQYF